MRRVRVIPVLTLKNEKLVKTVKFNRSTYIGDPINAVKIFNEKEVDELVILDITATTEKREPNYSRIEEIASEAFMPIAYGGGISNMDQVESIFKLGVEKIVLNSSIEDNFSLVKEISKRYGSQSVIISVDVKTNLLGKLSVYSKGGSRKVKYSLTDYIKKVEEYGAGEIFLTSIDKDGTYNEYNYEMIKLVSSNCNLPVVSCGGAKNIASFKKAIDLGSSAVAASSMFVYSAQGKGVLINYPDQETLKNNLFNIIT